MRLGDLVVPSGPAEAPGERSEMVPGRHAATGQTSLTHARTLTFVEPLEENLVIT